MATKKELKNPCDECPLKEHCSSDCVMKTKYLTALERKNKSYSKGKSKCPVVNSEIYVCNLYLGQSFTFSSEVRASSDPEARNLAVNKLIKDMPTLAILCECMPDIRNKLLSLFTVNSKSKQIEYVIEQVEIFRDKIVSLVGKELTKFDFDNLVNEFRNLPRLSNCDRDYKFESLLNYIATTLNYLEHNVVRENVLKEEK